MEMPGAAAEAFRTDVLLALGGGDRNITVAVLDGPVDLTHDCFRGARLRPFETAASMNAANGRATAHGTHVASLIFGQPVSSIEGLAPLCRGLIIPIFGDDGLKCSQPDLARAILLAVENGAHVINIGGGQLARSKEPHPALAQAVDTCLRRNVLIVAAAGNDGCEFPHIPAAITSVLAAGAMDEEGRPLASSNWGAAYDSQGILAPGSNIWGASLQGAVARKRGTSFATALVSGVAALLLSSQLNNGSQPDSGAVREALLKTAIPCIPSSVEECSRILTGRINIQGAIDHVLRRARSMSEAETLSLNEIGPGGSETRGEDAMRMPIPSSPLEALGVRRSSEMFGRM
jgi:cyanobactin maturation PatA/PatG family protease